MRVVQCRRQGRGRGGTEGGHECIAVRAWKERLCFFRVAVDVTDVRLTQDKGTLIPNTPVSCSASSGRLWVPPLGRTCA